ncbi:hypothetical protein MJO29_003514 [Puccinia striiformis f. sp. tritici]|uniref:Secreted protein n=2 Tax=Puccinia striiformis TaxID=27350 RepID=A0A0L0USQ8_9BASI|nr:uncharacterized protein Pst134EA_032544 [Puccinia striiformis f. sp. tritici]XP_047810159.1 hypothetical protein Pst134EA_004627 [Puccinia striiformis f. sp. tritici]KAI9613364.1 hypothetical protein H4Q26_009964 [Puccinia striiformis f. sp. tritici PST-130]KNE90102.1 hypothetical protein PSTG_16443 [Puccinia striiformis f. sp. tritici PST-78]POW13696.1 hypothetical protein PSHT_07639 [Puccinia striiformis]KAH9443596.1 hypothetical protein Pst134EA_032544 [Puccinia striiformis f. sp. tritic
MFRTKASNLRAYVTYVMAILLLHVQISEALLTPRPPNATLQHCARALQLTFGKAFGPNVNTYSCTTYKGVRYRCTDCNGGEQLNIKKQSDFTQMRWEGCVRSPDSRVGLATGVTVTTTKEFTAPIDRGVVELTGGQDGVAGEHFYKCAFNSYDDFNGHRPFCQTCV